MVIFAYAGGLRNLVDPVTTVVKDLTGRTLGSVAVGVSFCLSGFLIARSIVRRASLVEFATNPGGMLGWIPRIPVLVAGPGGFLTSCLAAGVPFFTARRWIPIHGLGALLALAAPAAAADTPFEVPVLSVSLTYTVLRLAFTPRIDAHGFARRGDFPYGMHLHAFPVQQTLHSIAPSMHPLANLVIAAGISPTLAALSRHLVERPSLGARDAVAAAISRRPGPGTQRAAVT